MAGIHLSIQAPTVENKAAAVVEIPLPSLSTPVEQGELAERSDGTRANYLQGLKFHYYQRTSALLFSSPPSNHSSNF